MMKKQILSIVAFMLFGFQVFGQENRVGINTTEPKTTLDVSGKTDTSGSLLSTDMTGLQAPRLTRLELTNKGNSLYGTDQKGTLIYITDVSAGDNTSQRVNITTEGYYYFDGSIWQKVGNGSGGSGTALQYYAESSTPPSVSPIVSSSDYSVAIGNNSQIYNSFTSAAVGTSNIVGSSHGESANNSYALGAQNNIQASSFNIQNNFAVGIGNMVAFSNGYAFGRNNMLPDGGQARSDAFVAGLSNQATVSDVGVLGKSVQNSTTGTLQLGWGGSVLTLTDTKAGIGTTAPNPYAKLQVSSSNQGVLIPSINLTSSTMDLNADSDNNVANQPVGLLIFNNGSTLSKGYYFWNGSEWRTIDNSTAIAPSVASVSCSGATLTPGNYTSGTPYSGTLTIPYSGGNGGSYSNGSPVVVNGLTFTLQSGKLVMGSGNLTFTVSGTPTVTSPTTTTVPINSTTVPFLTAAQSCSTTTVGAGAGTNAPGVSGSFISKGFNITATSPTDTKFCLGDLCVRYNGNNVANDFLQVSHTTAPIFYTAWSHWGTTGSDGTDDQYATLATAGTWGNLYNFGGASNTEGSHTVLAVVNKTTGEITQYQVDAQIILNSDSGATATPATSPGKIFIRIYQN